MSSLTVGLSGPRSFAQEFLVLTLDTPPNRWVRFGPRRGIHTPVVDGLGRFVVSCTRFLVDWAHVHTLAAGFGSVYSVFPSISLPHIWLRLFYIKCVIIHQANTQLSHISPVLFASACPPPTRAQAFTHPICLHDYPVYSQHAHGVVQSRPIELKRKTHKQEERSPYLSTTRRGREGR